MIYRDNSRLRNFKDDLERVQPQLNDFFQKLQGFDVKKWTVEDMKALIKQAFDVNEIEPSHEDSIRFAPSKINIQDVSNVIVEHLKTDAVVNSEPNKVFGFNISKSKLKELVEVPSPPMDLVVSLGESCRKIKNLRQGVEILKFFNVADSNIVIDRNEIQQFEESCCYYANTAPQIEMAKQLKAVCEQLNSFQEYARKLSVGSDVMFEHPAFFIKDSVYYPSNEFIKTHAR